MELKHRQVKNISCHSDQSILSYRFLFKALNITTHKSCVIDCCVVEKYQIVFLPLRQKLGL